MGKKKLLTLDDLYNYYSTHSRSTHFSAKDDGSVIVVQVPANLSFDSGNDSTEGLLPVVLQSCHIGKNLNHTIIEESVMTKMLPSFSNRPILGYIYQQDSGEWQFYKHNLHEDGNGAIVYDEQCIGIIPESCNARLEYDEEKDKTYVVVNGYIFEEYSKAGEILEREKECAVSVELSIREFSYNAKEHCLVIEDAFFSGVTILGEDPDGNPVNPGMEGSNIKLADFSAKNNSLAENRFETQIVEIRKSLDKLISCFDIDNSKKGGDTMSHFEELLLKYNKAAEDITFEYEGLSDEELDARFNEAFGEVAEVVDEAKDVSDKEEPQKEATENIEAAFVVTYELSHDDIRCALYQLLAPIEEADNTEYYIMEVFDNYFVYSDWYSGGKLYGQAYVKNDDGVAFEGDRYELFMELLTADEKAKLDAMRSSYEAISEKLKTYEDAEAEAKKTELLNAEDYTSIRDNEEFTKLLNDHAEISYEELQSKCDQILLDTVKAGKYSVANPSDKPIITSKKQLINPTVRKSNPSRYGKLFSQQKESEE